MSRVSDAELIVLARQARERAAKEDTEAAQARNLANTPPEKRG